MKKLVSLLLIFCLLLTGCAGSSGENAPDYSAMYLDALDFLWDLHPTMKEGVQAVSLDLVDAPGKPSKGKIDKIARKFAKKHDVEVLTLSREALIEAGYIEANVRAPHDWEGIVVYTIYAYESETSWSSCPKFTVSAWRSDKGPYYIAHCSASRNQDGSQKRYTIVSTYEGGAF